MVPHRRVSAPASQQRKQSQGRPHHCPRNCRRLPFSALPPRPPPCGDNDVVAAAADDDNLTHAPARADLLLPWIYLLIAIIIIVVIIIIIIIIILLVIIIVLTRSRVQAT